MKDTDQLQIQVEYKDGSIQAFGYDGKWFKTLDDALTNAYKDFKEPFKNVSGMSIVWNNNQLAQHLTKPKWGDDLIEYIRNLFIEEGVIQNGN